MGVGSWGEEWSFQPVELHTFKWNTQAWPRKNIIMVTIVEGTPLRIVLDDINPGFLYNLRKGE